MDSFLQRLHWRNASPDYFKEIGSLIAFIAVPEVIGQVLGLASLPKIVGKNSWYSGLRKPSWHPPNFLFGAVWPLMYFLMAVSAWLVWTHGGWAKQKVPLTLYAIQAAANFAWNPTFFNLESPALAFADILGLLGTLVPTIIAFHNVEPLAGLLMLPYLAWVVFATALNWAMLKLNPQYMPGGMKKREVTLEKETKKVT